MNSPALTFKNLCVWCEGGKREEGYCVGQLALSLTESLLSIAPMESFSFHTVLIRNLLSEICFCLLLRVSRKCDIVLSLNRFITRMLQPYSGGVFLQDLALFLTFYTSP